MDKVVLPHAEDVALLAAQRIAEALHASPGLVLGLATGRSMERIYVELVRMHRAEALSFADCRTFNLDEYIGLGPDHPNSYRHYMNHHLFGQLDLDPANTHVPDGLVSDFEAEGRRYETLIQQAGGIDLQLLGLGENGHIGFNEPASPLSSRTRVVELMPETRRQNIAMFGGDIDKVPRYAITMGIGTILDAREILLVVTGTRKAVVLADALDGPASLLAPASALRHHPRCQLIADRDATSRLHASDERPTAAR
jgi:glucosamine-6-phosphate deaminase